MTGQNNHQEALSSQSTQPTLAGQSISQELKKTDWPLNWED